MNHRLMNHSPSFSARLHSFFRRLPHYFCIFVLFIVFSILLNIISRIRIPGLDGLLPFLDSAPDFFKYGESICALIAAILVVEQLGKEAETEQQETLIQQSTFIRDYNQSFIENKDMVKIEMELEEFYANLDKLYKQRTETFTDDKQRLIDGFKAKMGNPGSHERQAYINYLVYLEGLAAVIKNGAMDIDNIDSLFGYRFFIAVNNPAIQELELDQYSIHYKGIFSLYEKWVREKKKQVATMFGEYCNAVRHTAAKAAHIISQFDLNNWEKTVSLFNTNTSSEMDNGFVNVGLSEVIQQHQKLIDELREIIKNLPFIKKSKAEKLIGDFEDSLIQIKHLDKLNSTQNIGYYGIPMYIKECSLSRLETYETTINAKSSVKL